MIIRLEYIRLKLVLLIALLMHIFMFSKNHIL